MSTTTNLIAELVRAANELHRLTTLEKRRLLERAARTIRDMEEQLGNVIDQKTPDLAYSDTSHLQPTAFGRR